MPSLAFLTSAQERPRQGDGNKAWLGVPGKRDFALEMLSAKVEDKLNSNGFTLHRDDRPESMSYSSLAVAAAHGGVSEWRRFVRITADRRTVFTPAEFARFFKGSECVVLLICSSGRSDGKPHAGETFSLVTELFENEVRAVIAPVWPLAIDVAEIWLEEFLVAYGAGVPAIDSTFRAARKVEETFLNPCAWAAMQLYGDGTLQHRSPWLE